MSVEKEVDDSAILNGILDNASMKRIILHWSAGTNAVNSVDKQHYHIIIDGDGVIHKGNYSIKDNESTKDGKYAAHTLGTNTGSIGVSLAGMLGATEKDAGKYPINKKQVETLISILKILVKHYKITVSDKTVLSHAEVEKNLGILQRGKIDICMLPFDMTYNTPKKVGDYIRKRVLE